MWRFTLEYADGRKVTQHGSNIFPPPDGESTLSAYWVNGQRRAVAGGSMELAPGDPVVLAWSAVRQGPRPAKGLG